jgi:hypothetical protein
MIMLTRPDEHHDERPTHSKAYEEWMGLLFLFGAVAALFATFFILSYFD